MERVLTKSKSLKIGIVLNYILWFCVFSVLNAASVSGGLLAPFYFGFYYAKMFKTKKPISTSIIYFLSFMLFNFNMGGLISALNLCIVAIAFWWIHQSVKKNAHRALVCLYAIIGNAVYITLSLLNQAQTHLIVINIVLGLMFLISSMCLLDLKNKNIKSKLTPDNVLVIGVMICVLATGLSSITVFEIEIYKVVAVTLVLFLTYVTNAKTSLMVLSMYGLGVALHFNNISYVGVMVIFAIVTICFKSNYKIISLVALVFCEVLLGLYFLVYPSFGIFSVLGVLIGELIFMLVPSNTISYLTSVFTSATENINVRGIINRSRESLSKRMQEISNVFLEMDSVYMQMVKGGLTEIDAKQMLKTELKEKCCKNCENASRCQKYGNTQSLQIFDDVVEVGFKKGKLNLLDIPPHLTSRCLKVNVVINTINTLLNSYKSYSVMVNNMDSSKVLIAEQLRGVSKLIGSLSQELNLNIVYDLALETRIKEELGYKNICCLEALVYEQSSYVKNVSLILQDGFDKLKVEKIVSKILNCKVKIECIKKSTIKGATEVNLKTSPNYDIVFGSASVTKTGKQISGDTHSLIKIDDGKFMVALCDGMGSGQRAHKISDLTLTLIENFYKAGFDNDIILNSVNKLLSLNGEENFSALDICVLDLRKNVMDFVKLGSPHGFIKNKNETEIIESCALPIGVLEEMQPHITQKFITDFNMVVLVSDGVSEAFGGAQELQIFINNLKTTNPQTLADDILDRSVDLVNGNCTDDFTVVAVRIFPAV